jgi:hypothetical protein
MVHADHLLKPEYKNIQNYRVILCISIGVKVFCRIVGEEHRLKAPGKRMLKGKEKITEFGAS